MNSAQALTVRLSEVGNGDVARVGGKNASLGEMIQHLQGAGIRVPGGFATTADAYRHFIDRAGLRAPLARHLRGLAAGTASLQQTGRAIRKLMRATDLPDDLEEAIRRAYRQLAKDTGIDEPAVAVRSSATAEDLPEASFAGQLETYLNVRGEAAVLDACRQCFASLFTDRAITYRENHGFDHLEVAVSVGVQRMVRSDTGGAGVMFSIDTETGFPDAVLISGNWGLGETVVQGSVDPDEYMVFKPLLDAGGYRPIIARYVGRKERKLVFGDDPASPTRLVETTAEERRAAVLDDDAILQLGRWAVAIERHYGRPMDMEWARDGETGELFVVQARPETVQSVRAALSLKTYTLKRKGKRLATGQSIGEAVAAGRVCRLDTAAEIGRFPDGAILVTGRTDPDWVPIMKRAAAIVTDHGGRTSHAAIVSRELGLPAVIGTGNATGALDRRTGGDGVLCRGRSGLRLRWHRRFRGAGHRSGGHPPHPHAHHAEPRQPGCFPALVAAAERRRRSRPDGVHHQQHHQDSSHGSAPPRAGGARGGAPHRCAHRLVP